MEGVAADLIWNGSRFVEDCVLLHSDGWIAGVVGRADVPVEVDVSNWGEVALLPGSVNAHGHAFQSLLKGYADDRDFESWRDDVLYPFSETLDEEGVYAGALLAFGEALLAGATTTVDFFYLNDGNNDNAQIVLNAAREMGINLVLARTFYDPDAPTRAPARYREPAKEAAERLSALAGTVEDTSMLSVQPAPHSLHAASPDTIGIALEVARDLGTPCHLHLAEARYEIDQVRERYGTTPVRLLHREGLLGPDLVTIHSVWLEDEELDMLAESGTGVVHCPGANAFLGDGIARLTEMLKRGIRLGLGPDGGCANNRQSVFDEMRMASLLAKAVATDGSALDAPTALGLGTVGGADLLRMPVGSLSEGRRADIVALDLKDLSLQPPGNLERHVVNSMQPSAIERVMVGGKVVAERGRLLTVPAAEIRARVAKTTATWTRP